MDIIRVQFPSVLFRVFGRVWFMSFVLKTNTWIKSWVQISQYPTIKLWNISQYGIIYKTKEYKNLISINILKICFEQKTS